MTVDRKRLRELGLVECANRLDQLFRQRHTRKDVEAELHSLLDALEAQPPTDDARIPREPTEDMIHAGRAEQVRHQCDKAFRPGHSNATQIWRAMYDAAPAAEPASAYGRWIENGKVMAWRLVRDEAGG